MSDVTKLGLVFSGLILIGHILSMLCVSRDDKADIYFSDTTYFVGRLIMFCAISPNSMWLLNTRMQYLYAIIFSGCVLYLENPTVQDMHGMVKRIKTTLELLTHYN